MNRAREQWNRLAERVDRMSLRERALIFIAVLAVLYLLAVTVIWQPLNIRAKLIQSNMAQKQKQVSALRTELEAMGVGVGGDPKQRIAALEKRIREIDASLSGATTGLVSPKEMARLAERILKKNRRLQLVSMESMKPEPVIQPAAKDANKPVVDVATDSLIYRHGLRIRLNGRYGDVVNYLDSLEAMDWKVFWGKCELVTDRYPISQFTLVLYTLSFDKGWIGI